MNGQQIDYILDLANRKGRKQREVGPSNVPEAKSESRAIPRIARLLGLAVRCEGLLRDGVVRDYTELAKLGRVTRARITQIMQLRLLAPDIQERILFLDDAGSCTERNVRPLVRQIDWEEQRKMWAKLERRVAGCGQ